MMNFNNPKVRRIVVGVIAGLLIFCMIVPLLSYAL